jgi:hypothetical protein
MDLPGHGNADKIVRQHAVQSCHIPRQLCRSPALLKGLNLFLYILLVMMVFILLCAQIGRKAEQQKRRSQRTP